MSNFACMSGFTPFFGTFTKKQQKTHTQFINAIYERNMDDIVKFLLIIDHNIITVIFNELFSTCVSNGDLDTMLFILSNLDGVQNTLNFDSLLYSACSNGHLNIVKFIIEYNLYKKSRFFNDPISVSCKSGHLHIMKYLISQNIPISELLLLNACRSGNIQIIKFVIDNKYYTEPSSIHSLMEVCSLGYHTPIIYLLNNIFFREHVIIQILKMAYQSGHTKIIDIIKLYYPIMTNKFTSNYTDKMTKQYINTSNWI